jgi:hypothetical protein
MAEEIERFFKTTGLEMNRIKSTTNTEECTEDTKLLEGISG